MAYSTSEQIELSESLGYTLDRCSRTGDHYNQGERNVWSCCDGWQTADLVSGGYENHQMFERLEDALNRPLK